ncbi:reverse transcriptase domain, reverse transcriptase zinc-binding domain protein [Tanacetum coccineum]
MGSSTSRLRGFKKAIMARNGFLSNCGEARVVRGASRSGRDTIKDLWEDFRLCDRFPRLFNLDRRPEGRVAEKGRWVEGKYAVKFNEDGGFAVKELTRLVEERTLDEENAREDTSWLNLVPKKVNIFVWRALKKRLPVREELHKRGIDLDTVLCPCCDSVVESCEHSLVMCSMAMGVWEKVHILAVLASLSVRVSVSCSTSVSASCLHFNGLLLSGMRCCDNFAVSGFVLDFRNQSSGV